MIHATTIVLKPSYYIANGQALPRCAFFPHPREPQARRAVVIAHDSKGGFPIDPLGWVTPNSISHTLSHFCHIVRRNVQYFNSI